ncbi:MAG TPA: AraC family transcriptional regulator [Firmicutes bacterium]|nr:AraC family transcriptional regulator [Bacillota bacterium]
MAKYNSTSICQFPAPASSLSGQTLEVVNFVYEPHPFDYDDFIAEDNYVFFLVTAGSGTFFTDYADYPIKKGDCCFAFPHKRYKFGRIERMKLLYITFTNAEALTLLSSFGILYTAPVRRLPENRIGFFYKEFERSLTLKSPAIIPKALLYFALSYFAETHPVQQPADKDLTELMSKIVSYVNEHYREKFTLQQLCEQYYFSYNYISQAFKAYTGTTFSAYVQNVRLRLAKELLKNSCKSVTQIAEEVGYNDAHYFDKVFKRTCGITPKQFRQRFSTNNGTQTDMMP